MQGPKQKTKRSTHICIHYTHTYIHICMYQHKIIVNYRNVLNVNGPCIIKKLYRAVRISMLQVGPYLLPFY